jgi:16S rRNA (guanine966-N2)-methyltransferase
VRIIGGKWKGRKVRFVAAAGLRPTMSRMRETLFNWLRPSLPGAACLDLFAGSGVLGIEALSQGAGSVCAVDSNRGNLVRLQEHVSEFGGSIDIQAREARTYLRAREQPFDIIFLDPPFTEPALLDECLALITERSLCRSYVYAEIHSKRGLHELARRCGYEVHRETRAGDVCGALLIPARAQDP